MSASLASAYVVNESLARTLDHLNEAWIEGGLPKMEDRLAAARWITERLGKAGAYAGGFAPTEEDLSEPLHVFTGEVVSSDAGRAHVLTEEAGRALMLLEIGEKRVQIAIREARTRLIKQINRSERPGWYCCAMCSVALWRHLAAGGLDRQEERLRDGVDALMERAMANGTWKSYPFYYTLLALMEMPEALAAPAIAHAMTRCETLHEENRYRGPFAGRRRRLVERVLLRYSGRAAQIA